jgi:hypothetical protein
MPLGKGVLARTSGHTINDGLRHQQPVDHTLAEDFVDIEIVALPDSQDGALFGFEVEGWVDLILAVGEEELHRWAALAAR